METNYTLKRLKLFWPVLALLMLSSFFVNAQVQFSGITVLDNYVDGGASFCDTYSATVTGSIFEPPGDLEITSSATFSTATINFTWEWSATSAIGSWQALGTLPAGVTATPVGTPPANYLIVGALPANVSATVTGFYNLYVTTNQTIYFRRVVNVVTNEPSANATVPSNAVKFTSLGEGFVCAEDNTISIGGVSVFCGDPGPVTITGSTIPTTICLGGRTCTLTTSQYWSKTLPSGNWEPVAVGGTGKDYVATVTQTTAFKRVFTFGNCDYVCESGTVTITVSVPPAVVEIIGDDDICIDREAVGADTPYRVEYPDELNYTFNWQVNATYGTINSGSQFSSSTSVNWFKETPCDGPSPAWVEVTVTSPEGCKTIIRKYVVIKKEPTATVLTEDEQEICGVFQAVGNPITSYNYAYAIKLEAETTTLCSTGQWTAPTCFTLVVPKVAGQTPNPFSSPANWEVAPAGAKTVWAVMFEGTSCCLDADGYEFTWEEFGCGDPTSETIKAYFYKPVPVVEAWSNACKDAAKDDCFDGCGDMAYLWGTQLPQYCDDLPEDVTGTWTVKTYPAGADADDVVFYDANNFSTNVTVAVYGTYVFTWTIDNGVCGVKSADVEVTFSQPITVDAGVDQKVCNTFSADGIYAKAWLEATVSPTLTTTTGTWSWISKPSASKDPEFEDVTNKKTEVRVQSLGTYVFRYTATNGVCSDYDDVVVSFYPDIKDVKVTPATAEVCSLAYNKLSFTSAYDMAKLSNPASNLKWGVRHEVKVYKLTGSVAAPTKTLMTRQTSVGSLSAANPLEYEFVTNPANAQAANYASMSYDATGKFSFWSSTGQTSTTSQDPIIRFATYGEYEVEFKSWIVINDQVGTITPTDNVCIQTATSRLKMYHRPTASILAETGGVVYDFRNREEIQVCGLGTKAVPGTTITMVGNLPRPFAAGVDVDPTAAYDYRWRTDVGPGFNGNWNDIKVAWTVEEQDGSNWVTANTANITWNATPGASNDGRTITAHAHKQGTYKFTYRVYNLNGPGCEHVVVRYITFLEKPYAGLPGDAEFCGFIYEGENEVCDQGWNSSTRYVGYLDATSSNENSPNIGGYWKINVGNIKAGNAMVAEVGPVGYLWDQIGWTPAVAITTSTYTLHDWIRIADYDAELDEAGTLVYTVNPLTGAISITPTTQIWSDPKARIEVSRPGIFTFTWVTYNVDADYDDPNTCKDTQVDHVVYFKNTPQAREITPIKVTSTTNGLLYGGIVRPFEPCYTCDEVVTYYMLERPIIEQAHGVGADDFHLLSNGKYSTIPPTFSARWYYQGTAGYSGLITSPVNIPGGQILASYYLNKVGDNFYLDNTPGTSLNANKHHIIAVRWNDGAEKGEIRLQEENTVTECVAYYTDGASRVLAADNIDSDTQFEITLVQPQKIAGPLSAPAFSDESAAGVDHVYALDPSLLPVTLDQVNGEPIPGAKYKWTITGDADSYIVGYYNANNVWVATTGKPKTVHGLGWYKIHVYWGKGLDGITATGGKPYGKVKLEIDNYCHGAIVDEVTVIIVENTFAGQLKYWNQDETYIPTPYKFHPSNNFDYFYVYLYDVTDYVIANTVGGVKPTTVPASVVNAITPEIKKIMVDPANQAMQSYFEFRNLNVNKYFLMRVVDGGFYHLAEAGSVRPNDNFLSFTYTWNRWDGIGVNAADALAVMQMAAGANLSAGYPWVGANTATPAYGFHSNAVANVDGGAAIDLVDAFHILNRFVGTFGQFQNNVPNFQLSGRKVTTLPQNTFTSVGAFSAGNASDLRFAFGRMGLNLAGVNYAGTQNPENFYWQSNIFKLNTEANYMNLYLNATGDINSRFSVPGPGGVTNVAKVAETGLSYVGSIEANVGEEVTIPVRLDNAAQLGAMSVGLNFNNSLIEVLEVSMPFKNIDNENGSLRVANAIVGGRNYGENESILNITVRVLGEMKGAQLFTLQPVTEFHNAAGEVVDVTLHTNLISTNAVTSTEDMGVLNLAIGNYPNPFRTSTTIEYTLPESGKVNLVVYNQVGQVVTTLVNETQQAGLQSVVVNSTDLGNNDGMFIYRISVEGMSRTYVGTGNFMLVK